VIDVKLTSTDVKRVVWLLHPEVRVVIAIRAVFAQTFLLPGMKMVNSNSESIFLFFLLLFSFSNFVLLYFR
jgi:hypothetical protein